MENAIPESGLFQAIFAARFSYMDCCTDSFLYLTHSSDLLGISLCVSAKEDAHQTLCRALQDMTGKRLEFELNGNPFSTVVRQVSYNNPEHGGFSCFEMKTDPDPILIKYLSGSAQRMVF